MKVLYVKMSSIAMSLYTLTQVMMCQYINCGSSDLVDSWMGLSYHCQTNSHVVNQRHFWIHFGVKHNIQIQRYLVSAFCTERVYVISLAFMLAHVSLSLPLSFSRKSFPLIKKLLDSLDLREKVDKCDTKQFMKQAPAHSLQCYHCLLYLALWIWRQDLESFLETKLCRIYKNKKIKRCCTSLPKIQVISTSTS